MKAALYARYSSDKQRDSSIADQFYNCERIAEKLGFMVVSRFEDKAITPPLKLKIIKQRYVRGTQIADRNLCAVARMQREFIFKESPPTTNRFFQFLAYVNQSDWLAKRLVRCLRSLHDETALEASIKLGIAEFNKEAKVREKKGKTPLAQEDIECLEGLLKINPLRGGVLRACDDWITENLGNAGRLPSDLEFKALMNGPLDGEITMSFALQWRYNFSRVFGVAENIEGE
jgi:hypothetical protein